ncbi:chondroitin proteoglycan-2-like [Toxorhynchites rutilus septentrionalis]|uniref:chondroitin proteoglycan-2-like n=1 Tax=Toxorhynchites rutilus septentrionalis TaxID=329112 RepID=UPI002479A937|nr:chondroitin proteoglycan-2-like [Toxorhynchites rutilus septentrionalis]
MKTVLLVAICVALVSESLGQNCYGRSNGSIIPDLKRCNVYYSCNNGVAISMSCPSGYHYNAGRQICDRPISAGCVICPPTGFKNIPVAGACRKFIQCVQGVATERECPKGLLFDPYYGQCNLEQNVKCQL